MASVNKWIGIGRLGREPETRYSSDGKAVCNVSIACSQSWKDKVTGKRKEETEWVRVVFYGRLAEIAGEYLTKGREIYVEGRLRTRKWTSQDGKDNYTTEIIAEQMQMLGGNEGGQDRQSGGQQQRQAPQQRQQPQQQAGSLADMEDDPPF